MLTSLQAQLELGDMGDLLHDYRPIAAHCLAPRFVPNIPAEGVALHHQSLRGMTPTEAKKAFLNLIQSWPLHRATIFDVMVSLFSPSYFYLEHILNPIFYYSPRLIPFFKIFNETLF